MTIATIFGLLAVAFLAGVLGGAGGRWIAVRELRRRLDSIAEDVEGVYSILRKRSGRAAVDKREAEKKIEQDEMEQLRARALAETQARKPRGRTGPVSDADAERAFSDEGARLVAVGEG